MSEHYSAQRVRRGIGHFLWGKAFSALLNFAGFLLVARLLPTAEYGRYVALIAIVELGLNLASLGLDWVSTRYIPEYRIKASSASLTRFVLALTALQGILLIAFAAVLALFAEPIVDLVQMDAATTVVHLYAGYLAIEGLSRVVRDQMLGQLMLQGRAQLALVLRHLVWVGTCLYLMMTVGYAELITIAAVEIVASTVGLVLGAVGLWLALRDSDAKHGALSGWSPPSVKAMRALALNSYLGFLLNLPARPQIITLLVARFGGVELAGLYGFARNLTDQALRFLPAEMLLGFIRPALVARYVASGDFVALNRQTNQLLVVSLLVLSPLIALALGQGELLVAVVGAEKFAGSGILLALMLVTLAPFSHRRVLEFVANTISAPQAIGQASFLLPLVPLLVVVGLSLDRTIWFIPIISTIAELLFGCFVAWRLRRLDFHYAPPLIEGMKLVGVVAVAALLVHLLPMSGAQTMQLVLYGALSVAVVAALAGGLRLYTFEQLRQLINRQQR